METVHVFSDVICPWCYVGGRRLAQAVNAVADHTGTRVQVRYHAFELNPDMPVEGLDRRQYRAAKFGSWERSRALDAGTETVGAADGIVFDYPAMRRTPNTRRAHRLIKLADRVGRSAAMADRLFVAYFSEGRDVGDPVVLADLGRGMGLGDDAVQMLEDATLDADVETDIELARRAGVSSVPLVVAASSTVAGAGTVEELTALLTPLAARRAPLDGLECGGRADPAATRAGTARSGGAASGAE